MGNLPVEDLLADTALNTIRDRYYAGVTAAENAYKYNRADEDAVTGALGQALVTPHTLVRDAFGNEFTFSIYHRKIRGRGHGAPEKTIGADGIFQLEVYDKNGKLLRRKGLLFQSKKEWQGKDGKLGEQAKSLLAEGKREKAVVIDFGPTGYSTCSVAVAAKAQGNRNQIAADQFSNLSATLGDEFVRCRVGVQDLYYDGDNEVLYDPTVDQRFNLVNKHVIGIQIQRLT